MTGARILKLCCSEALLFTEFALATKQSRIYSFTFVEICHCKDDCNHYLYLLKLRFYNFEVISCVQIFYAHLFCRRAFLCALENDRTDMNRHYDDKYHTEITLYIYIYM